VSCSITQSTSKSPVLVAGLANPGVNAPVEEDEGGEGQQAGHQDVVPVGREVDEVGVHVERGGEVVHPAVAVDGLELQEARDLQAQGEDGHDDGVSVGLGPIAERMTNGLEISSTNSLKEKEESPLQINTTYSRYFPH
jgi:hypothetical protein